MKTKEKVARVALKQMRLADLKDHPRNPRKHPNPGTPEWNVLKKSLANAYWDPMVVNVRKGENHMTLVSGHLRRKVLTDLGYTAADVSTVDVDGPTHLAMMLAANQQQGQNDEKALAGVLMELQAVPEFDVEIAGFTVPDIETIVTAAQEKPSHPPEEFASYDVDIHTDYCCPKCGYKWSGKKNDKE